MTAIPRHTLPIGVDPGQKPIRMKATEVIDAKWGRILREVNKPEGDDYIILRNGQPVAVVIDYDYYLHLIMGGSTDECS